MTALRRDPSVAALMAHQIQHDLALLVLPTTVPPRAVDANGFLLEHERYFARRLAKRRFETEAEAYAEANFRANSLAAAEVPGAGALAAILRCDEGEEPAASLAHPVYTRLGRRVEGNDLLTRALQARAVGLEVATFTAVSPLHVVRGSQLPDVEARTMIRWLRRLVQKHLPANARGWMHAQIHGEFEPTTSTFVLHFHGLVH